MTDQDPNNNQHPQDRPTSASTITRFWLMGAIGAVVLVGAIFAGVAAANLTTGGADDANDDDVPHTEIGGSQDEPAFYGLGISPPWPKPDMVLTDTSGNDFDIVEDTEGYVTLLFMGYTNCPSECPTHMLDIATTLNAMDEEDADQVKVLFITTDPERDTPERLREWLDNFNPNFIGLTADRETIVEVQQTMGVPVAETYEEESIGDEGYGVSHSLFVFAFDRETELAHLVYPLGIQRGQWLNDLTRLVQEGYQES